MNAVPLSLHISERVHRERVKGWGWPYCVMPLKVPFPSMPSVCEFISPLISLLFFSKQQVTGFSCLDSTLLKCTFSLAVGATGLLKFSFNGFPPLASIPVSKPLACFDWTIMVVTREVR